MIDISTAIPKVFEIYYKKKQFGLDASKTILEEGNPKIKELRRQIYEFDENKNGKKIWEVPSIQKIVDIILTRWEILGIRVTNKQISEKEVLQAHRTAIIRTHEATGEYLAYMGKKKACRYMPHFQDLVLKATF